VSCRAVCTGSSRARSIARRPHCCTASPRALLPAPLPTACNPALCTHVHVSCSAAEKAGLSLSKIESLGLLSTAERLGLLTLAEDLLTTDPGKISSGGCWGCSAVGAQLLLRVAVRRVRCVLVWRVRWVRVWCSSVQWVLWIEGKRAPAAAEEGRAAACSNTLVGSMLADRALQSPAGWNALHGQNTCTQTAAAACHPPALLTSKPTPAPCPAAVRSLPAAVCGCCGRAGVHPSGQPGWQHPGVSSARLPACLCLPVDPRSINLHTSSPVPPARCRPPTRPPAHPPLHIPLSQVHHRGGCWRRGRSAVCRRLPHQSPSRGLSNGQH
jgi:hypothetical protein